MTMKNEYYDHQIARFDNAKTFVEVLSYSFNYQRVVWQFIAYNQNKQKGSKIEKQVPIFLSFEDILLLEKELIGNQRILKEAYGTKKKANGGFDPGVPISRGGTSAQRLRNQGKSRPDGKAEARILSVKIGDALDRETQKPKILLVAQKGPGKENRTGLISPDGKPDVFVQVALSYQELQKMIAITAEHVRAYLSAHYVLEAYKEINKKQSNNNYNKNNYNQNNQGAAQGNYNQNGAHMGNNNYNQNQYGGNYNR